MSLIFKGKLSDSEYFGRGGVNATSLKEFANSPSHYQSSLNAPRVYKDCYRIGSVAHAVILEDRSDYYIKQLRPVAPKQPCLKKDNPEKWQEWKNSCNDHEKIINQYNDDIDKMGNNYLKPEEVNDVKSMYENVKKHSMARCIINKEWAEISVFVECPQTGLTLKAKYDCLPDKGNIIFDLKTCQDASEVSFSRDISKNKYWLQDAHYSYVAELAGFNKDNFVFVAVEKTAPYLVNCISIEQEKREQARMKYFDLLEKFAVCKMNKDFSKGYGDDIKQVNIWI